MTLALTLGPTVGGNGPEVTKRSYIGNRRDTSRQYGGSEDGTMIEVS